MESMTTTESKGECTTTKRITETSEGLSDTDHEAKEQAPLSPSSSSKMDHSNFSEPQNNELESSFEHEDDDKPILSEGTVLVVPETVSKTSSPFKGPEFEKIYKKLKAEGNIGEMIICCTSCSTQINHKMTGTVFVHPLLHVLLCRKCKNFYNSGGFTKDENGIDEYCRWCAEGGDLLCCDECPHAFCKACIRRNFGRSELSKISKLDVWQCLICDPSPLLELQATCLLVLNYIKKKSKRKSEKGLSHSRALFPSPSMNVTHKEAIEICMENAVQAGRFLRDGVALLRKKLVSANDPNVYAGRVGNKLIKLLQVTKENLDSIARAIDRELEKMLLIEQSTSSSTNVKAVAVQSSSSTRDQKLEERVQVRGIKIEEVVSDSNDGPQPLKPEDNIMESDETEIAMEMSAKSPKSNIEQSDETINGNKVSESKRVYKAGNNQQNSVNEELLTSSALSYNDESILPDIEIECEPAAANVTKEHIEELESLENITPDDDKNGDNVQEDADIMRSSGGEVAHEATLLDNDATILAPHVSPLKNNDNLNQRTSSKTPKKVDKTGEDDRSSKKLKIILKKLPTTSDLDKDIVKKDKLEKKRNKQNHKKEKDKIGGKSSRRSEKKATSVSGKDSLENSALEDNFTDNADINETVMYQIESSITDQTEDTNDFESGAERPLKVKGNVNLNNDNSNESNSEAETLIADAYDTTVTCDSPKAKSEDGELWDAKTKKHAKAGDDVSDAETIPGSFNSDYKNNLLEKSALKDAADMSDSDSGNDASFGDEPCIESGNEDEVSKGDVGNITIPLNNLVDNECENTSQAADNTAEAVTSESKPYLDENDKKSANCHATDISDEAEQDTKQIKSRDKRYKSSQNIENQSKKAELGTALNASDDCLKDFDNNSTSILKGLPSDQNKIAKNDLLNRLFEDSEEAEESLAERLEEKLDSVREGMKKPSRRSTKDLLPPQNKGVILENDIEKSEDGVMTFSKDGELSEAALAKKSLLSCLQSGSDNDNEITVLGTAAVEAENRKSSTHEKTGSPIKSSADKKRIPKPKSARTLDEISSESSLSSEEEVALPKTKAARKIIPIADIETFINEDPKLKLKVTVVLQPLKPGVMKQLATCGAVLVKRRQKAILSEAEALDRDINRLCNLKSLQLKKRKKLESDSDCSGSSKSKALKAKEEKPVNILKDEKKNSDKKKPKNEDSTTLFTSSSEDENLDSADLDEVDAKGKVNKLNDENDIETVSMNKRAKDMLSELLKMTSDEQSDEGDEDAKKKSKNAKNAKDEKEGDSGDSDKGSGINSDDDSDDFSPVKKNKRFNSKLLRVKLSDSDESYKASSDSRDVKKRKKHNTANSKGSGSSQSSDDSSDDATAAVKRRKRRTRGNAKSSTSTDGDSHSVTKKKKRRRIKTMTNSSDSDVKVVEDKNGTPTGKGRKNIRHVIRDTKLREDTKFAAREEEERRNRVIELQKQYNVVVVASGKDGAPITKKLVLENDSKTKEALVEVHPDLISKLKPHQVDGVKFLWESMCESLERLQTNHGSGCILAHCMGLGKTLQVIAFLHTLLANENTCIKTALVVCPLNTVINWFMEFRNWLDEIEPALEVTELSSVKSNYERARAMKYWAKEGGIMIIGYEMFRNLVQEKEKGKGKGKRKPKSCKETFQSALINPGPDIVVCDEGHLLKNSTTSLSKAMSRIGTRRRVVLTGTPLQNNLAEYHCMVDFVKPSLLGTMKEFKNRFVNPIQNGQCADSTSQDVRIMKRRAHILHNLLDGCVQRRDYNVLTPFLPQKHEYVISIRLTEIQVKLYVYYLENLARRSSRSSSLFSDYQQLMRIWTHPRVIRLAEIRQENKIRVKPEKHKKRTTKCMSFPNGQRPTYDDSDNSFIDDGSTDSKSDSNVVCIDDDEEPSTSKGRKKGDGTSDDEVVNNWKSRSRGGRENAERDVDLDKNEATTVQSNNWWTEFISEDDAKKFEHGGKLILLFSILKECYNIGDKLLLFSQSLLSLDLIETMLQESRELNEDGTKNSHYAGRWVNGTDYFRLDGSTSADTRSRYTRIFNDTENFTARLFLISTRAGSLGINLVAANRVIVFDASWNPSHDVQSIFRVYRFGQEKPVYVYRFLAHGTMEEKIYDRQVTKQSLACRVVDEQQIERHFNFSDLQELYTFTPERVNKRPTPRLPKDRLLAELLIKKKDLIVNYHEHDSLLVNQEAEELSEEERKAAWVEYEVERKGMMDASGQQMSQGLYGVKLDIASLIHGIQVKEPGLSVTDLTAKLRDTITAIHQARREALEQQRQEILRVQLQNQQRDFLAAQQKREIMAQVQQRIAHGDLTPEQIAWYSQVMGPDQSQLSKLLHQPPYVSSGNPSTNLKPQSILLSSMMENLKNTSNK